MGQFDPRTNTVNNQNQQVFTAVRVKDVILDTSHPLANTHGGPDAIGTIFYTKLKDDVPSLNLSNLDYAKPIYNNINKYPLKNEIVLILATYGSNYYSKGQNHNNYYFPPINVWNSPNQNSLPYNFPSDQFDRVNDATNKSSARYYGSLDGTKFQAFEDKLGYCLQKHKKYNFKKIKWENNHCKEGSISRCNNNDDCSGTCLCTLDPNYYFLGLFSTPIWEGDISSEKNNNTFTESDIKPLQTFEGDVIVEGRFGNSIRFGSTNSRKKNKLNPWSFNEEEHGAPIIIIRNGQEEKWHPHYKGNKDEFAPTIENINADHSSIYLTSNQIISNFIPASINQLSFGANLINADINPDYVVERYIPDDDDVEITGEDYISEPSTWEEAFEEFGGPLMASNVDQGCGDFGSVSTTNVWTEGNYALDNNFGSGANNIDFEKAIAPATPNMSLEWSGQCYTKEKKKVYRSVGFQGTYFTGRYAYQACGPASTAGYMGCDNDNDCYKDCWCSPNKDKEGFWEYTKRFFSWEGWFGN